MILPSLRPLRWLGAPCPGGLALPAARPTAAWLYGPRGVWVDGQRIVVADTGNHRVLIWQRVPEEDHAPADVVLAQASFDDEGPAAHGRGPANGLQMPTGVIVVGEGSAERLLVADAWHHRILLWHGVPTRSDTPPDACIGQATLTDVAPNRGGPAGRDTLRWPYGLAWIGGRLHVADTGNRRVLIWDCLPDGDMPADHVLGQPTMEDDRENRGEGVGPCSFRWPHAIAGDAGALLVADAGNHRVLGWRGRPGADGRPVDRPAEILLGQDDFRSSFELPHVPQGASRLRFPYGLALGDNGRDGRDLFVADTANNRILRWGWPAAEGRGAHATGVLGQRDFAGSGENRWQAVDADSFCWPYGIAIHAPAGGGRRLAVADSGNNRVMIWQE